MTTAIYHQPSHLQDRELFVVKENEDGTLDLADKDKKVVVSSCPVTDSEEVGCCSVVVTEPEQAKKQAKKQAKDYK